MCFSKEEADHSNYPCNPKFRASASQALQKALKKGRLLKTGSLYKINPDFNPINAVLLISISADIRKIPKQLENLKSAVSIPSSRKCTPETTPSQQCLQVQCKHLCMALHNSNSNNSYRLLTCLLLIRWPAPCHNSTSHHGNTTTPQRTLTTPPSSIPLLAIRRTHTAIPADRPHLTKSSLPSHIIPTRCDVDYSFNQPASCFLQYIIAWVPDTYPYTHFLLLRGLVRLHFIF